MLNFQFNWRCVRPALVYDIILSLWIVLLFYVTGRQFSFYPDSFTSEFISSSQMKAIQFFLWLHVASPPAAGTVFKYLIAYAFFLPCFYPPPLCLALVVISVFTFGHRENQRRKVRGRYNENKLIVHVKSFSELVMNCLMSFASLTEFVVRKFSVYFR